MGQVDRRKRRRRTSARRKGEVLGVGNRDFRRRRLERLAVHRDGARPQRQAHVDCALFGRRLRRPRRVATGKGRRNFGPRRKRHRHEHGHRHRKGALPGPVRTGRAGLRAGCRCPCTTSIRSRLHCRPLPLCRETGPRAIRARLLARSRSTRHPSASSICGAHLVRMRRLTTRLFPYEGQLLAKYAGKKPHLQILYITA